VNKKTVRDIDVRGKRVFLRADLNVPLDDGRITDDTRIRASLPTIRYLLERGAAVILASHLGRPKGKVNDALRLKPVADRLGQLLGRNVRMTGDALGPGVQVAVGKLRPGDLLLLENLRFYAEEEGNEPGFAKALADMADIYVNDAFGSAHRAHASTEGITHYLPAVAGLLLEEEPGHARQEVGDPLGRGMRPMRRPERVVDVDVGHVGQRLGEAGVVPLLLRVEAQVLEQEQVAGTQLADRDLDPRAKGVTGHPHVAAEQQAEPIRDRLEAQRVVDLALRPAEVAGQDHRRASLEEIADGGQAGPDAGVVGDPPIVERDVQVGPQEDPLAPNVDIPDRLLVHAATAGRP